MSNEMQDRALPDNEANIKEDAIKAGSEIAKPAITKVERNASIKRLAREQAAKLTDEQIEQLSLAFQYYYRNKPL